MKIHEFDPLIYPRRLWVVTNANKRGLLESFDFKNAEGLDLALKNNSAVTALATNKSSGYIGVIVFTTSKKYLKGSTIAHEAVHFADAVFEELSMTSQYFRDGNEPYAYLVGWAAKCINEARLAK